MTTDLEDRLTGSLRRHAGATPAPTAAARQRIHAQAGTLQRRRTTRRITAAAALVSLVVGAGMWLRVGDGTADTSTDGQDMRMDPPHRGPWPDPPPGDGTLPDFRIDGFTRASADDFPAEPTSPDGAEPPEALQIFREPGNWSGPVVGVEHMSDCGECDGLRPDMPDPDDADDVTIGDRTAKLWTLEPDGRILSWTLEDGTAVYLGSRDLTTPEVLAFARGLERRGAVGFEATELPQGLAEEPRDDDRVYENTNTRRMSDFRAGDQWVQMIVEEGDGELVAAYTGPFSTNLYVDLVEHVAVAGQPGVLLHVAGAAPGEGDRQDLWTVVWRPTTDAVGAATFAAPDRASAERIVAAIH